MRNEKYMELGPQMGSACARYDSSYGHECLGKAWQSLDTWGSRRRGPQPPGCL